MTVSRVATFHIGRPHRCCVISVADDEGPIAKLNRKIDTEFSKLEAKYAGKKEESASPDEIAVLQQSWKTVEDAGYKPKTTSRFTKFDVYLADKIRKKTETLARYKKESEDQRKEKKSTKELKDMANKIAKETTRLTVLVAVFAKSMAANPEASHDARRRARNAQTLAQDDDALLV
jgi:hypothetical protein